MDYSFLNTLMPELLTAYRLDSNNMPKPSGGFGYRKVISYELDFITWGEGYMMTDGVKSPATKGKLFIRRPGMYVDGFLPYHCYYMTLNLFGYSSQAELPKEFPDEVVFKNPAKVEELFFKAYTEFVLKTPASQFLIRTYLMQIFLHVYENLSELSSSIEYRRNPGCSTVREIAQHIEENVHLNFTLDELSKMSGYSRFTFCRQFKAVMGSTPVEFINNSKMGHARRLLLETDKSVKEICLDCGFENESYFYILFRKLIGCSPMKYRKDNRIW